MALSEAGKLSGMVTVRDIAPRKVSAGKGPDTRVPDALTWSVKYCFEVEPRWREGFDGDS